MMRTRLVVAALCLATACGGKKDAGGGSAGSGGVAVAKPRVAVSIFPLYDITRRVAGDRLEVMLVLPPGKSEHAFDPSPREIAALDGSKLGIAVGLDMDTWVEVILKNVGNPRILHVGDSIQTMPINVRPIGADPDDSDPDEVVGAKDPHIWLDPDRMSKMTDVIAAELATLDPAGKATFTRNAEVVKTSLGKLDAAIAARAKVWTKHAIVTFHGSMSYFAKRYGVTIAAVVEPIAGKEPTAAYITEVLTAIKQGQAAAMFIEPQFERGPGETISKEANIPLGELDPVGGVPGRDTYEALLTWDTDQLEKALK